MKSLVLLAAALAAPAAATGPFTVQETGRSFYRLDDAVKSVNGGDGTILIAPGSYRDCAIVEGGRMAFRANPAGSVILDGGTCEGKAALVLRGRDAMVDGLVFQNMRVPDGNGAGIRLERGGLTVMNAMFRASQQGILTADDPASAIRIDRSTFSRLGTCESDCAHSVYVGDYGRLTVTRSRFEKGTGGHYVKSRARTVEISGNSFDDSAGQNTNYHIDLPAGSTGSITGNIFVQGKGKENHTGFIVVAAEARDHPSAGLVVSGNSASLAPGVSWPTNLVTDFSREPLRVGPNQLARGIKSLEVR